jgi:hypothetical protein
LQIGLGKDADLILVFDNQNDRHSRHSPRALSR